MADELERLARDLFSAGANERPAPELRERLRSILPEQPSTQLRTGFVLLAGCVALAAGAVLAVRAASVEEPDLRIDRDTARVTDSAAMAKTASLVPAPSAVPPSPPVSRDVEEPTQRAKPRGSAAEKATAPRALGAELALLNEARSHLAAGNAARALQVLARYDQTPGALHAEATLLRIEALAGSGRRAEAAALARGFIARYPESPLVDRARRFSSEPASGGVSP